MDKVKTVALVAHDNRKADLAKSNRQPKSLKRVILV
jgi:methylglyoxal synthase